MKIINKTNGNVICDDCRLANTVKTRIIGLLGRKSISENEGLIITGCRSIHSYFMKFPICAIFIDKNNNVVKVIENFKINRLSGYYLKADRVIELPPFKASQTGTKAGDKIEIIEVK